MAGSVRQRGVEPRNAFFIFPSPGFLGLAYKVNNLFDREFLSGGVGGVRRQFHT